MNFFLGKSRRIAGAGVLALTLVITGCESAPTAHGAQTDTKAEETKIRALDVAWVKAAATKNPDAWDAFYSEDALVLPPNEKTAKTKDAIRTLIAGLMGMPGLKLNWTTERVEVSAGGDMAYAYGLYTMSAKDAKGKPFTDTGKTLEIWKKQANGEWKCVVDTWNSDLPAQ